MSAPIEFAKMRAQMRAEAKAKRAAAAAAAAVPARAALGGLAAEPVEARHRCGPDSRVGSVERVHYHSDWSAPECSSSPPPSSARQLQPTQPPKRDVVWRGGARRISAEAAAALQAQLPPQSDPAWTRLSNRRLLNCGGVRARRLHYCVRLGLLPPRALARRASWTAALLLAAQVPHPSGMLAEALPGWFEAVSARLLAAGAMADQPNQVSAPHPTTRAERGKQVFSPARRAHAAFGAASEPTELK